MNGSGASEPLRKAPIHAAHVFRPLTDGRMCGFTRPWDFFTTKELLWTKGQTKLYFGGI